MVAMRALVLGALAAVVAAQEAPVAAVNETEAAMQQEIVCPIRGGGFDDRYAVAQVLILQKNLAQAEACLLEAIASTLGALSLMSDIAATQRLPLRAAAFSSVLTQLNPSDGETVYLHAQRLGQAGAWNESIPLLDRLATANPSNANIQNSLGAAHFQAFDYDAAVVAFAAAHDLVPDNVDFAANLKKASAVKAGTDTHDSPVTEYVDAEAKAQDATAAATD